MASSLSTSRSKLEYLEVLIAPGLFLLIVSFCGMMELMYDAKMLLKQGTQSDFYVPY